MTRLELAGAEGVDELRALWLAWKGMFEKHRKVARVTFPIWLYVSVTGVVVYVMLYQIPV